MSAIALHPDDHQANFRLARQGALQDALVDYGRAFAAIGRGEPGDLAGAIRSIKRAEKTLPRESRRAAKAAAAEVLAGEGARVPSSYHA